MLVWKDLKTDPPTGDEYCVLLFPCKTDCGLLYITSNTDYARGQYALDAGYTHWAEFNLAPTHAEAQAWQDDVNSQ